MEMPDTQNEFNNRVIEFIGEMSDMIVLEENAFKFAENFRIDLKQKIDELKQYSLD